MPERPSEITDDLGRFDRLAEAASRFVSEAAFFIICAVLVVVWVAAWALARIPKIPMTTGRIGSEEYLISFLIIIGRGDERSQTFGRTEKASEPL